jgi:hypothetical protein
MDESLLRRILLYIEEEHHIVLDDILLHKNSGFHRLKELGFVDIRKVGDMHIATLTFKGLLFLRRG